MKVNGLSSTYVTTTNNSSSDDESTTISNENSSVGVPLTKSKGRVFNKILIVDDSLSNRKLTARLLKSRGYDVDEANDGIEAVEKVDSSISNSSVGYDVILMDSEMPRMSGPTATEVIRQKGYIGFIIGVTGNVMQQEVDIFMSKGANKVLFKPLDMFKLEAALILLNASRLANQQAKSTSSGSSNLS